MLTKENPGANWRQMGEQNYSDRVSFSPKGMFLKKNRDSPDYRILMGSDVIKEAFRDSIAEMAWRGATQEQLSGARILIDIVVNLSEKETSAKPLPSKPLISQ